MRQNQHRLKKVFAAGLALCLLVGAIVPAAAKAASNSTNLSGDVTQSYNAGSGVQAGMLVELSAKKSQTVVPLSSGEIKYMLGVVVPTANAPIVLAPATPSGQQVLVATSGRYSLLVTNQNGAIKTGDYLTISSLNGVGMKADANQSEVIGRADGSFDGSSNVLGSVKLKNQSGQAITVNIASLPIDISVTANPLFVVAPAFVPGFLNKAASDVANKTVSTIRIYLAMALLAVMAFIIGSILYGSLRGGMIALGRNPLSKQAITHGLMQVLATVLIIFAVGVFAVYLLLKL